MKVEKKKNISIFFATYWNFSSKSGNLEFFALESSKFGPFLPLKKPKRNPGVKSYFSHPVLTKIGQ